jgi:hypothetical protein
MFTNLSYNNKGYMIFTARGIGFNTKVEEKGEACRSTITMLKGEAGRTTVAMLEGEGGIMTS